MPAFRFRVDGKHFDLTELFENDEVTILKNKFKIIGYCYFSNCSDVVCTENNLCVFKVKMPFANFSGAVWTRQDS